MTPPVGGGGGGGGGGGARQGHAAEGSCEARKKNFSFILQLSGWAVVALSCFALRIDAVERRRASYYTGTGAPFR